MGLAFLVQSQYRDASVVSTRICVKNVTATIFYWTISVFYVQPSWMDAEHVNHQVNVWLVCKDTLSILIIHAKNAHSSCQVASIASTLNYVHFVMKIISGTTRLINVRKTLLLHFRLALLLEFWLEQFLWASLLSYYIKNANHL